VNPAGHERRRLDLPVSVDQRHRVVGVQGARVSDQADLAFLVAVEGHDACSKGSGEAVGVVDAVGQARGHEVRHFRRRLGGPARVRQRDHVPDRPGVIGDDVREHEPLYTFGMLDSEYQRHATAGVMTDERGSLDPQVVEQGQTAAV
jgi:hypothetical protein